MSDHTGLVTTFASISRVVFPRSDGNLVFCCLITQKIKSSSQTVPAC